MSRARQVDAGADWIDRQRIPAALARRIRAEWRAYLLDAVGRHDQREHQPIGVAFADHAAAVVKRRRPRVLPAPRSVNTNTRAEPSKEIHMTATELFDDLTGAAYYGYVFREVLLRDPQAAKAAEALIDRLRLGGCPGLSPKPAQTTPCPDCGTDISQGQPHERGCRH